MVKCRTAESATEGHPDKVSDQLSDAILDAILERDAYARASVETTVATGLVLVAGELTSRAWCDFTAVVRGTLRAIGYADPAISFDYQSCAVLTLFEEQSAEIGVAVDRKGAGDCGIVVGYATSEGADLPGAAGMIPVEQFLAHRLAQRLSEARREGRLEFLYPDGKTQATVEFDFDGRPREIREIVLCAHHHPRVELEQLRRELRAAVVEPVIGELGLPGPEPERVRINPIGPFTRGGPAADVGLTGRKIVSDTYGPAARHGGSSLSGKDPTKTDRSGAYMARYLAKNLVAAGLAQRAQIELAYVLGVTEPVAFEIETFGSGAVSAAELAQRIRRDVDLTPAGIIERLDLRRPIYRPTAVFGHYGRLDLELPWERCDLAESWSRS